MSPLTRLLASFIALMMAMGIGRFALTPQMPHLLSEGQIDLTGAGLIAAANYLGYFVGAVDSIFARSHHPVRGRLYGGLWLCVLLTLASYWAHGFWPHLLLRFGTGVASAWALVMITSLSQPLAIAAGRPRLGALVFAGPGLGILLTGLLALGSNLLGQSSATLWLVYGGVALLMLLAILPFLPRPSVTDTPVSDASSNASIAHLGWVYFLYGLGYIIPATFLSQMASAQFKGAWQADLFWPCFRPGGCARGGRGEPAPQGREHNPPLADDNLMVASGGRIYLLARQRLGPGAGRIALRRTVSGVYAVGDGTLARGGAPRLPAQHWGADRELCHRTTERPIARVGEQPPERRPATGAGDRRLRVVIGRRAVAAPGRGSQPAISGVGTRACSRRASTRKTAHPGSNR